MEVATNRVEDHTRGLFRLYSKHPVLEIVQEGAFPFLFLATLISYNVDAPSDLKYTLAALTVLSYSLSNKIPMSLSTPTATTAMSLSEIPYYAAFSLSIEAVVLLLLLILGFALIYMNIQPESKVFSLRSDLNREALQGVLLVVPSVYVLTLLACK